MQRLVCNHLVRVCMKSLQRSLVCGLQIRRRSPCRLWLSYVLVTLGGNWTSKTPSLFGRVVLPLERTKIR